MATLATLVRAVETIVRAIYYWQLFKRWLEQRIRRWENFLSGPFTSLHSFSNTRMIKRDCIDEQFGDNKLFSFGKLGCNDSDDLKKILGSRERVCDNFYAKHLYEVVNISMQMSCACFNLSLVVLGPL